MDDLDRNPLVRRLISLSLEEDLGLGDVTSDAIFPDGGPFGSAIVEARQSLRVAGTSVAAAVFREVDPQARVQQLKKDGSTAAAGEGVLRVEAPIRSLLKAERPALNFLQKLSGIATLTAAYVERARTANPATRICDTRKTPPGFRVLAKHAVRCGGGFNHRFSLADASMIKDNHILAAGSITNSVRQVRALAPHTARIVVEADTSDQVDEALAAGADVILLDNMSPDSIRKIVHRVAGRAVLEASGGITLETVAEYAATGVDVISIGALTHSAPAADFSLHLEVPK